MYDPHKVLEGDYRVDPESGIPERTPPRRPQTRWRRLLAPLLALLSLLTKAKVLLVPLKFLVSGPIVGPTVTALISVGAYALAFGWQFGVGLVAMLFIHEMGHVLILRRYGVRATAPIFIPFLGAVIAMRQLPRDAVMEAYVGLGGPVLGALGAFAAWGVYAVHPHPGWLMVAYVGLLLNLFNLLPIPPLDGGRAMAAISPWLWGLGIAGLGALIVLRPNPILLVIVLFGGIELIAAWRRRRATPEYYRVPGPQRLTVSAIYFGLIGLLALGLFELSTLLHLGRPI